MLNFMVFRNSPPESPIDEVPGTSQSQPNSPPNNLTIPILISDETDQNEDSIGRVEEIIGRQPRRSRRHSISSRNSVQEGIDEDGPHWLADSDSSLDETDIDMLVDAKHDKNIYRYIKMK